jgi:hypothetical protein
MAASGPSLTCYRAASKAKAKSCNLCAPTAEFLLCLPGWLPRHSCGTAFSYQVFTSDDTGAAAVNDIERFWFEPKLLGLARRVIQGDPGTHYRSVL